MIVAKDRQALADARAALPGRVALVPTMGALHEGHLANVHAAAVHADSVVASIFVNPLQFRPDEDFDSYPRQLDADLETCAAAGVDLVFAPDRAQMYPEGPPQVTVRPGPLGEILEGASRPGFFDGVLTVVAKLFAMVRPDLACFGEKDFQQLTLIRRMVRDLDLGVDIVGVATVREASGLAMSSRNGNLDAAQWTAAEAISRSLHAAAVAADPLVAAQKVLDAAEGIELDYLALTDPELGPAPASGSARLLVAAEVGATRLIDNAHVTVGADDA